MIYETRDGAKIHAFDYREGYVRWCATCGDGSENGTTHDEPLDGEPAYDHPFVARIDPPSPCYGCGGLAPADYQRNEEGIVQPPGGIMPRNDPNREERLIVVEATATATTAYWARVVRSPTDPPRFDPLEYLDAQYEAYILRYAQRALREVAGPG